MKSTHKHIIDILRSPRITEKGALVASHDNAYVFNVSVGANKKEIAEAIQLMYKVTPRQIRVVRIPRKRMSVRGTNRSGMTAGGKKAYVYLKQGDTIEFT